MVALPKVWMKWMDAEETAFYDHRSLRCQMFYSVDSNRPRVTVHWQLYRLSSSYSILFLVWISVQSS